MVIATLQAEAGKLWIACYNPCGRSTWCTRGAFLFLESDKSLGVFGFDSHLLRRANAGWGVGLVPCPTPAAPDIFRTFCRGPYQGSAAGAAIGSVTCCGLVLLGKCRGRRETEEVSIRRARAGHTGSCLAGFLTHEFQHHRTAAPRLQCDRHLQCVAYVNDIRPDE